MSSNLRRCIVAHNVVHLRARPTNDSELVSQTLMGRVLSVLREEAGWVWVEGDDTYRGWADQRWLRPMGEMPLTETTVVFSELRTAPSETAPLRMRLPILCGVYRTGERKDGFVRVLLPDGRTDGWLPQTALTPLSNEPVDRLGVAAAEWGPDFLGTPYLWGGSSSFGLDCSGFVQLCYRLVGVLLRRDADIQRDDPRWFHVKQEHLKPGDLVFFGKPDRITHVGMHLAGNTFIHSAGGAGVLVTEWGDERYSPGYVDARRIDPTRAAEPVTRFEAEDR
ncbi:MAG: C40 family peptidase [Capsulimonadales bacterium]|nr:C40 family peptidase [Capsulimonadales bacterium]